MADFKKLKKMTNKPGCHPDKCYIFVQGIDADLEGSAMADFQQSRRTMSTYAIQMSLF